MFKKIALLAVTGALVITSTGCAGIAFSSHKTPLGGLYTQASSNEMVVEGAKPAKDGEACAVSYLGWITLGDASAKKAAEEAGVSKIASVDHDFTNILGLYSKYCVRVSGQ